MTHRHAHFQQAPPPTGQLSHRTQDQIGLQSKQMVCKGPIWLRAQLGEGSSCSRFVVFSLGMAGVLSKKNRGISPIHASMVYCMVLHCAHCTSWILSRDTIVYLSKSAVVQYSTVSSLHVQTKNPLQKWILWYRSIHTSKYIVSSIQEDQPSLFSRKDRITPFTDTGV
jgi:hypothetical protein